MQTYNLKNTADTLLMIFLLLASGMATQTFRSIEFLIVLFLFAVIYLSKTKAIFSKRYLFACFFWIIYVTLSYIKYFGENYFWPFPVIFHLTVAFAVVNYYKYNLFDYFTKAMWLLSLWSLILFSWQIIDFSSIVAIWDVFDLSQKLFDKPYTKYSHTFFYTIHQFYDASKGAPRNAGFAWEPGAYSCFIVTAIYFQLLKDGYKVWENKLRYTVFFLALLSTQSTTGLVAATLLLVPYLLSRSRKQKLIKIIALFIAIGAVVIFSESHISKIENQLSTDLMSEVIQADASEYERGLGRFQSIAILSIDFLNNPLLGLGEDRKDSWIISNGFFVNATSGIGNMFATYGLFLMIPFLYYLGRSSKLYAVYYRSKSFYIFFIIILILGFSFNVIETPVFIALVMFSLFVRRSPVVTTQAR